jgi:radical SAM protein with 4Fe4S-binding SPASM domain
LDLRRSSKSDLQVEWQMLDLEWNKHEQQNARRLAREMGVDSFTLKPEENTIRLEYESLGVIRNRNCLLPYLVYIVDAYGRVRPCYKVYTSDVFVGDTTKNDFESIWNGDEMSRIRNKSKICRRSPCMTCWE